MQKTDTKIEFDMVIPHYKDEVFLSELLHDVISTNFKFKPNNIHVLNDGEASEDFITVCTEYSKYLPIRVYECEKVGHVKLVHDFVIGTETENILISHADVGLKPNNASVKYPDPISVLSFYLSTSNDITGISCNSIFNGEGLKGKVSASDNFISNGQRQIARGYFTTIYRGFKSNFPLESMLGQYERVLSFDDKFYGLKSSVFKEMGGFDDKFVDYQYYLDDYFCRCRKELNKHAIFTNETAVKHGVVRDKPEGSLVFNQEKHMVFNDTWLKSPYVQTASLREEIIREEELRMR